ncbi:MBL fold metallo-hydrolase [Buchananella hordeovulneris]|uniref:Metallo-beta-lactamase domain-containing protein n=2 Tax=Buchananella hordeovulneris TaxID=52770 RepID=A0A1Q5PW04_9ACTO|nr:MBL fold metallo-hydrolase [Buchananella hordeovulneris]OKL51686.1 hypothetical protein BSZ40_05905 [Buchananella hordeovulneris]RRD43147.1 MBL fold metallo-hydrolase [Buchananella hordeovulneris]RRD53189.1 MBL fold metallo-hydrolase [Buchananella hordeovulneris]
MRLTIVGSSGSMSGPDNPASCYLLQAPGPAEGGSRRIFSLVLDMGPGSNGALMKYLHPSAIDFIGLSHCHADHMVDIIGQQVFRKWHPDGHLPRTMLYGPSNLTPRMLGVSGDAGIVDYSEEFILGEWRPGVPVQVGPFVITAFPAWHPVEAYAIRVEGPSALHDGTAIFTYSGDTDRCDTVVEAAYNADLFLCEAAFLEGQAVDRGVHLTGVSAGQLATDARAKALVLTHIQPWTNRELPAAEARTSYSGPLALARPGDVYEF